MCELLREKKISISSDEATVMALGIYEDTGSFTYTSTTPADFEQAGFLISCGACLTTIASLVVKEMKTEQVTWLNELINEMTTVAVNGIQVHLSAIAACNYIPDLASIVQKIVRMENLDCFFAIVLMGSKCMSLPETACMNWMWVKYWVPLAGEAILCRIRQGGKPNTSPG